MRAIVVSERLKNLKFKRFFLFVCINKIKLKVIFDKIKGTEIKSDQNVYINYNKL